MLLKSIALGKGKKNHCVCVCVCVCEWLLHLLESSSSPFFVRSFVSLVIKLSFLSEDAQSETIKEGIGT